MVDRLARDGFGAGAEAYERGRPSYPPDGVAHLVERLSLAGRRVAEVGAGTGKMTRLLVAAGCEVVAVEPVEAMRAGLRAAVPGVEVLDGPAESLPLPDRSAAAVVAAQAFHWFDAPVALAEVRRVAGPGGGLGLVWNVRDEREPWVAELTDVIGWRRFDHGHYGDTDWPAVVREAGGFTPLELATFELHEEMTRARLADRVASISYVAAMDEPARQELLERVDELTVGFTEPFDLPYRTDVWTASVLPA